MQEEIETVQNLHKQGKLERKLLYRIIVLSVVATFTFCILLYELFFQNLEFLPVIGFAVLGFLFGFYIFIRMNKVYWDKERQIVAMGRFDFTTIVLLIAFILYRISLEKYFSGHYEDAIQAFGYSLATLFGGMVGRLIGTLYAIDKSHREKK